MTKPVQIVFRNTQYSEAVAETIRRKVDGLESAAGGINTCRVTVSRQRNDFHVCLVARLRGRYIVVNRDDEVHVAVRDAFEAAERQFCRRKAM